MKRYVKCAVPFCMPYLFAVSPDPAVEVGTDISVLTAVINPAFTIVDDFALCRSEIYTPLLNF